jgi:endonuclease/exonuclease/phosphatase family metal-dependent hydrolase
MKSKKIISIIIITALCLWKISSQAIDPANLSLSGSGFEVKSGAIVENDSLNYLILMTYNLWYESFVNDQSKHAQVISGINPGVVALQEVMGKTNFNNLKAQTGMNGKMFRTEYRDVIGDGKWSYEYGIGMLWNPAFGTPSIKTKKPGTISFGRHVAYMIAEFNDFCFVCAHYPTNVNNVERKKEKTTALILSDSMVLSCQNAGKPIYIAGDLNSARTGRSIKLFEENGFEILTGVKTYPTFDKHNTGNPVPYAEADYILEYNKNPNRKTVAAGRVSEFPSDDHKTASDHFPVYVKVKLK